MSLKCAASGWETLCLRFRLCACVCERAVMEVKVRVDPPSERVSTSPHHVSFQEFRPCRETFLSYHETQTMSSLPALWSEHNFLSTRLKSHCNKNVRCLCEYPTCSEICNYFRVCFVFFVNYLKTITNGMRTEDATSWTVSVVCFNFFFFFNLKKSAFISLLIIVSSSASSLCRVASVVHQFSFVQIVGGIYVLYTVIFFFFFHQAINYENVLSFMDTTLQNNTDYNKEIKSHLISVLIKGCL